MKIKYRSYKRTALHTSIVSVLAVVAGIGGTHLAVAETRNCVLVDGILSEDCVHDNAGMVINRPSPVSAGHSPIQDLGEIGFSITIDAGGDHDSLDPYSVTDSLASMDRTLTEMGLRVTVDGLGARPLLNISTTDMRRSYQAGEKVNFRTSSNYPAWIVRAEIVITDPRRLSSAQPIAVLPTQPNSTTPWVMPEDGPDEMVYILRVYDEKGRRDETGPLILIRSDQDLPESELNGPIVAAGEGEDRTIRRRIPVRGGAVTVSGHDFPKHSSLSLMGEPIILDLEGNFVIQRILPPGAHSVTIHAGQESQTHSVTIPHRDFFGTGIADITLGHDRASGEDWRYGRIAGFVDGVFADGTRLTASVDTRDSELRDMFRHFSLRHPDQILRQIEDRDVWITTGDDSKIENLAPTSGRVYAKLERDNNHIMWGDFRPESDLNRVVRTDRTLYGASGRIETSDTMPNGEARATATGYAAQIDRLTQRDVFRGTGGSSYFLSRRGIESGTETLIVETRDPVSGRIISSRYLVEGRDYRIDYIQGVVILNAPLNPTESGAGLASRRPLGDYDVNLVAQYDYVPTIGASLTDTYGGRAEGWVTPYLRLGVSGSSENVGLADNTLVGADLLLQRHEATYLSVDITQSEGPGISSRPSLTGGLDIDPEEMAAGIRGQQALGTRVEGRIDLSDLGGEGYLLGWFEDREKGFWSPDYNALESQRNYGVDGVIDLGETLLTFGAEDARLGSERRSQRPRVGVQTRLNDGVALELELAYLRERNLRDNALEGENGSRTDLAGRLVFDSAEDYRVWLLGQTTLETRGDLKRDNRIGIGSEFNLTDALTLSGEASTGNLGFAGLAGLAYRPNAGSSYRLGLREDRTRTTDLSGASRRSISFGTDQKVNDEWSTSSEILMGGISERRSLTNTHGVTYTPDEVSSYSAGVLSGQTRENDGTNIKRDGLSFGLMRSDGETLDYRLRTEYRRDRSDNPDRFTRRHSWLISGDLFYKTSEDWRFISGLDVVLSKGDGLTIREGRYIEGRLGYAYRTIDNDKLNALLSYTFLDDKPSVDQINIDGNVNGPGQRSHILNAAASYDLDERWTLGVKYGFRHREQTDRITEETTSSIGHLGVARLDYRIVHKWDLMGEARAFHAPRADTTEYGALLGVYRELSPNARIGVGYSWGGVSDDMRKIERAREGVFINLIGKF